MTLTSGRSLEILAGHLKWIAWAFGAPVDPRWREADAGPTRPRTGPARGEPHVVRAGQLVVAVRHQSPETTVPA